MNKAIFHIGDDAAKLVDLPFLPAPGATIIVNTKIYQVNKITYQTKTYQVTKITYQLHDGICTPVVHCISEGSMVEL